MEVSYKVLNIPFHQVVVHSQARRNSSDSLLVMVGDGNFLGYGECLPRKYVSGETLAGAILFIKGIKQALKMIETLQDLKGFVLENKSLIDRNPAAWCACELAMVDFLAKKNRLSSEKFLNLPPLQSAYQFSAVIPKMSDKGLSTSVNKALDMGIRDFKFKIDGSESLAFVNTIKGMMQVEGVRVRADANNLWPSVDECLRYLKRVQVPWWAIEEPLIFHGKDRYWDDIMRLQDAITNKIILDDSFQKKCDLEKIISRNNFIFNLRLSKLGGILRTQEIMKVIDNSRLIIGCHVGETSLLTRAALSIANSQIIAREGAVSDYLLSQDPFLPRLKFGPMGLLDLKCFDFNQADGYGMELMGEQI